MTNVYSIKGTVVGKIKLPDVFSMEYRPDLIQRAVVADQANKRQRYSVKESAGLETSAEYFGSRRNSYRMTINRGMSRLPREKQGGGGLGRVKRVPQAVGGRSAHPPKGKSWFKKLNKKEYLIALKSAIAATINPDLIALRGHKIQNIKEFPIIIDDSFQKLKKTKEVLKALSALEIEDDLNRAREKKIRAGVGKIRGRKYKKKKSALIIVNEDLGINKGAGNIPGIDVAKIDELSIELLAPGTHAGRLTIWTKSAINNIDKIENRDGFT